MSHESPSIAAQHSHSAAPTSLPTGHVVFLYINIEAIALRWEQVPEPMREAIGRYQLLLRAEIEAADGQLYQMLGDTIVAVFSSVQSGIRAAVSAQRRIMAEPWDAQIRPLQARMALHYGEGQYQADGYHAEASLNRVFRLLSAGHGGQILLTGAAYAQLDEQWPEHIAIHDLGAHRLRDLTTEMRVWQVSAPDLPHEFPPLRSLSQHPNNLPAQPNELFGRASAIAELSARLRNPRLRELTLTGLGGIGKTRLALAVAAELLPDFPDGVWFAALDLLQEASQVESSLAALFGIDQRGQQGLGELLADWLRAKRLLLILDNCEHVVEAAPFVAELLRIAPGLKVLATSRVPVGLYGEQEFPVPALDLPSESQHLEVLGRSPAVQLFVARASEAQPAFRLTAANAAAIGAICQRLEGIPLAIELAAARVRAFSPEEILGRLKHQLDFLAAQGKPIPDRQQTLRATLDWSYSLLTPNEQKLLAWLSVFVGGASLEALTQLWAAQEPDVVDGLITLIGHSLIQPLAGDERPRYRMLELVREFAAEQLSHRPEAAEVSASHSQYFQGFVAPYFANRMSDASTRAIVAEEYPNIRAALLVAVRRDDAPLALSLAAPLIFFWGTSGMIREGWQIIQQVLMLPLPHDASRELQLYHIQTQQLASSLAHALGEHAQGRASVEAALAKAQLLAADELIADCLNMLAHFLDPIADRDTFIATLSQAMEIYQRLGRSYDLGIVQLGLGMVHNDNGNYAQAEAHALSALAIFRELGVPIGIVSALNNLGDVAIKQRQLDQAEGYFAEALPLSYTLGVPQAIIGNLLNLGGMALSRGDTASATHFFSHLLQWSVVSQLDIMALFALGYCAWLAEASEQAEQAARSFGAYEAQLERQERSVLIGFDQSPLHESCDRARAQLGTHQFEALFNQGQQLGFAEAIEAARELVGTPPLDEQGRPLPLELPRSTR